MLFYSFPFFAAKVRVFQQFFDSLYGAIVYMFMVYTFMLRKGGRLYMGYMIYDICLAYFDDKCKDTNAYSQISALFYTFAPPKNGGHLV